MFRQSHSRIILGLFALAFAATVTARAAEVNHLDWKGSDLFIRFSDSVAYRIDLTESDTAQLVIRFSGVTAGPDVGGAADGPEGSQAVLTPAGTGAMRLTVHAAGKLGYASVWRPYSHTLVIHTFDWDKIQYPEQQYYKGLLALEQGLDTQATELLQVASSTGEHRASSALGVYYARRGNYGPVAALLDKPLDADDYAALAAMHTHNGDTVAARTSRQEFEKMMAEQGATATEHANGKAPERSAARGNGPAVERGSDNASGDNGLETNEMIRDRASRKWLYLGGGIIALLLLVGLVMWISRRSARRPVPPLPGADPLAPHPDPRPDLRQEKPTPPVRDPYVYPGDTAAKTVEATVVDSRPHVAATEPAKAGPVAVEPVAVEPAKAEPVKVEPVVAEPVKAEPVKAEPAIMEPVKVEPAIVEPVKAEPVKAEPAIVEPVKAEPVAVVVEPVAATAGPGTPGASTARPGTEQDIAAEDRSAPRSTPRQAADLRRRIEAMRPQPTLKRDPARTSESTVAEARRLQLSRDSVELRRKLDESRR